MSLTYRLLYLLRIKPWEQMAESPTIVQQISRFLDREEEGRRPPFGHALDLGCGSGIWATNLASRGWSVTGVDNVPKALRLASKRAEDAGVELKLVNADVTSLGRDDVGDDFSLLLDFGCFHDELKDDQRKAMGGAVSSVAAPGATLLMTAFSPRPRSKMLPRGAGRDDIQSAYPDWQIVDDEPMDVTGAPKAVQAAEPRFYRLRHG